MVNRMLARVFSLEALLLHNMFFLLRLKFSVLQALELKHKRSVISRSLAVRVHCSPSLGRYIYAHFT